MGIWPPGVRTYAAATPHIPMGHPSEVVHDAVSLALEIGTVDPQTVAFIARNASAVPAAERVVIDVGDLARYDRPLPGVTDYDSLLAHGDAR